MHKSAKSILGFIVSSTDFVDTDLPDDLMNWPLYDFLYCI